MKWMMLRYQKWQRFHSLFDVHSMVGDAILQVPTFLMVSGHSQGEPSQQEGFWVEEHLVK